MPFKRSLPFAKRHVFTTIGAAGEEKFRIVDDPEMCLGVPAKSFILSVLSPFGNATFQLSIDGVASGRTIVLGPSTTINVSTDDGSLVSRVTATADTVNTEVQVLGFTGIWTDDELDEYSSLISGV
jgi:hypothetical protein